MPIKPAYYQNKLNRLNTIAEKMPLTQSQQRAMTNLQGRLGTNNTPQMTTTQGDTRVPNLNTIGMAAPTGGMLPAGGGGVAAPGTSNMPNAAPPPGFTFKKGGKVKKMDSGGMTSKVASASKRGDGIAQRGKTKGRMC